MPSKYDAVRSTLTAAHVGEGELLRRELGENGREDSVRTLDLSSRTAGVSEMDEEQIFLKAVGIASSAERAEFLDEACADNGELRQNVEALLRSNEEAGDFLEKPLVVTQARTQATSETDTSQAEVDPAEAESHGSHISLSFLEPSDRPESVGRLGDYEILNVLGQGGMGTVFKALDPKLRRIVAVKVLAPQLAASTVPRQRFLREAQTAAAISHPHVTTIYSVDESHTHPYLVMEYVDGQTLQEKIKRQGRLGVDEILRIGSQIARGLDAAHSQGLVHRDIKPSNILLDRENEDVKITDFGLARAVDDVGLTKTGEASGTPQFLSPEQAYGERVDHRCDLFSLGSVLYMMCAGLPPFNADSVIATVRCVCDDAPRPLRELNPDIPLWLAGIIDRLLAKKPDDRFQTAREVAELLELRRKVPHSFPEDQPTMKMEPERAASVRVMDEPSVTMQGETRPVSSSQRARRRLSVKSVVLGMLIVALGVAAAVVIRVATDNGQLIVEVEDSGIETDLGDSGLTIRDTATGREYAIAVGQQRLRSGAYEIKVDELPEGVSLSTDKFTLTRGGRQVLKVTFHPASSVGKTSRPGQPSTPTASRPFGEAADGISVGLERGWLGDRDVDVMCDDDPLTVTATAPKAGFFYLVLIEPDGSVCALYPWIDGDWTRRMKESKRTELTLDVPCLIDRDKTPGCCTLLLGTTDDPLEDNRDLSELFTDFPRDCHEEGLAGAWYVNGNLVAASEGRGGRRTVTLEAESAKRPRLRKIATEMQKLSSVFPWSAGVFFDTKPAGMFGPPPGMGWPDGPGREKPLPGMAPPGGLRPEGPPPLGPPPRKGPPLLDMLESHEDAGDAKM